MCNGHSLAFLLHVGKGQIKNVAACSCQPLLEIEMKFLDFSKFVLHFRFITIVLNNFVKCNNFRNFLFVYATELLLKLFFKAASAS